MLSTIPRPGSPVVDTPTIHMPGTTIVDSGIYDIVDEHGTYLNHQEACIEGQKFPALTDPRAEGYVLHSKTRHLNPPEVIWLPRQRVTYSGIYDVVDSAGSYLNHQITCVAGRIFPPIRVVPHGYGFVLTERVSHMAKIYEHNDTVPATGEYDPVDLEGLYPEGLSGSPRLHFAAGARFPDPKSIHEDAIGFMPLIHPPGKKVQTTGDYHLVDGKGLSIVTDPMELYRVHCVAGEKFPPLPPSPLETYGYMLL